MPIIQLKSEHSHNKNKSISINDNKFTNQKSPPKTDESQNNINHLQINPKSINQQIQKDNNKISNLQTQQKQTIKQPKQPKRKQSKSKKTQKALNVQIIKPQRQNQNNNFQKIQSNTQTQTVEDKKSKKKKKRKFILLEDISPQMRLKMKTQQIYSKFMQKYKIPYNPYFPQMNDLLKESFIPFAQSQIQQQKSMFEKQQENVNFNRVQIYNDALFDQLMERKSFHEDRIYYGVLQENQLFNDLIWRKQVHSQPKKDEVALLFNDIHMMVINDVWQGEYEIREKQKPSKDEIIYGSYKANQIRMAQSIIKQKLSNLNDDFTINVDMQDSNDSSRFNTYKKFDLNSQQTKKAEEFIKKLKEQERLAKQRAKQAKIQQQQQLAIKIQQQLQQQKRLQQQKIQQRRVKLMQKAQQRQKQKKYRLQQQKQYQQYLQQHRQKTPLFKKKQEDFKAFLIKQHIKKLQVMRQIQKNKRSISKDQIQIHQMKYQELKQLMEQEKAQMMKLQKIQSEDFKKSYYKSKFHQSIMTQIDRKTLMQQKKSKAQQLYTKKIEYATIVKNNFIPKVDLKKKQQLQRLINDLAPKPKDDKFIAQKTKMEGISNLQKLHLMMAQMRAKGKIKKASTPPSILQSQNKKSRYINYLNEIKSSRMMNSSSMRRSRFTSLDSSKLDRNSLGTIELQARNLQQSADRKSLFLKNTKNLDMEDYLDKKFELEEDYIQSARAKLKVLSKYRMED